MKNGNRQTHSLKNQAVKGFVLQNDCVITCGRNSIRFHERAPMRSGTDAAAATHRRNGSRDTCAPNAGTIGAGVGEANIAGRAASSDAAALTSRESRCGARGGVRASAGWCEEHGGADTRAQSPAGAAASAAAAIDEAGRNRCVSQWPRHSIGQRDCIVCDTYF